MQISILFLDFLVHLSFATKIPDAFRGSPEIFSGYLPNSEKFVESFMFTRGLVIKGNSTQIEKILAETNPKGKLS